MANITIQAEVGGSITTGYYILVSSGATGTFVKVPLSALVSLFGGGGTGAWGDITGDIADQTDLTAAITAAVNAAIDGAPGALNTLNELAAALGDDANFAATVTAAIAAKQATLVSGTNIKTINGESVLGAGNIEIAGGSLSFTEQTTSEWNGDEWREISGNLSLTIGAATTGVLMYKNLGSHTLEVEGEAIDIRTSAEAGGLGSLTYVTVDGVVWVQTDTDGTWKQLITLITPAAPTGGVVDDTANTFAFTESVGYTAAEHEYSTNNGSSYSDVTVNPISVGNVAITSGHLKVRVKAVPGVSNASAALSSAAAFTVSGGGAMPTANLRFLGTPSTRTIGGGNVTAWADKNGSAMTFGASGTPPTDAGADGLGFTVAGEQLVLPSPYIDLSAGTSASTFYYQGKPGAAGALMPSATGGGTGIIAFTATHIEFSTGNGGTHQHAISLVFNDEYSIGISWAGGSATANISVNGAAAVPMVPSSTPAGSIFVGNLNTPGNVYVGTLLRAAVYDVAHSDGDLASNTTTLASEA